MWNYEKRLEYPINIKEANPALARLIITQFGGPDCGGIWLGMEKHGNIHEAPMPRARPIAQA